MRATTGPPPSPKHPFVVFLLALCAYSGIIGLIFPPGHGLPVWLSSVWAGALIVCAAVTLAGIYSRDHVTALLRERMGMRWFAVVALVYSIPVLLAARNAPDLLGVLPLLGFSAAAYCRVREIRPHIDELRDVLDTMEAAHDNRDDQS